MLRENNSLIYYPIIVLLLHLQNSNSIAMAGIYLHIPFCKTRCIYCDFYSTTRSELITRYIHALCNELEMRKEYLKEEKIETVYFGGGTPSNKYLKPYKSITDWKIAGRLPWKPIRTIYPKNTCKCYRLFPSTASVWEYKLSMTQLSNY